MRNSILFPLPGNETLAAVLAEKLKLEKGLAEFHEFPDGECHLRVETDVENKFVIIVCTLDHPNIKFLSLIFLAETLRELGAKKICLVAPYLPYMRQDKHFKSGDALTSAIFAKLLSGSIDQLITIDPHLHRIHELSEIYSIPSLKTLHASKKIAEWILDNVNSPFILGPDAESEQWVNEVAGHSKAPYAIIKKNRRGDNFVEVKLPDLKDHNKTMILVDDIISTGATMLAVLEQLKAQGFKNIICIGVHALFSKETYENLLYSGATRVVTCNAIPHFSNAIDLTELIEAEIKNTIID